MGGFGGSCRGGRDARSCGCLRWTFEGSGGWLPGSEFVSALFALALLVAPVLATSVMGDWLVLEAWLAEGIA